MEVLARSSLASACSSASTAASSVGGGGEGGGGSSLARLAGADAAPPGSAQKSCIEEDLEAAAESEPEGLTPMRSCSSSPLRSNRRRRTRTVSNLSNTAL